MNGAHAVYGTCHVVSLVIINYFDFGWPYVGPYEADSPLIIYANAVLALSITLECFEPVARWSLQKIKGLRCIQLRQLSLSNGCESSESSRVPAFIQRQSVLAFERLNHAAVYYV